MLYKGKNGNQNFSFNNNKKIKQKIHFSLDYILKYI